MSALLGDDGTIFSYANSLLAALCAAFFVLSMENFR